MILLCAAALVLGLGKIAPAPVFASSGGPYEIDRELVGPGGVQSGGPYFLIGSLESTAGTQGAGSGGVSSLSGYLVFRSSYVQVVAALAVGRVRTKSGWDLGVGSTGPVRFVFDAAMSSSTLFQATTVYLLADNLGNPFGTAVPFSVSYDTGTFAEHVTIPGGWRPGYSYQVVVGTPASNADGGSLAADYPVRVQGLLDFSLRNVLGALGDPGARVELDPLALPGQGFIIFHSSAVVDPDRVDPQRIQTANLKALNNLGSQAQPVLIREINAYDVSSQPLLQGFSAPVRLSLSFMDADKDNDGRLDSALSVRTKSLRMWVLDEASNLWVKVPGSAVDLEAKKVTAPLAHFSVYALIAVQDEDVSLVYTSPVPWRPFAGNPDRYGCISGCPNPGITFRNIPQTGTVRIYTLSGQLVREQALTGSLQWVWDGKNSAGEDVVSGVYLWIVESGRNKKTGKLMVIK